MSVGGENSRVAFSSGEFAALFGKSQTWGYRQIYAGKVKTSDEYGRIMIPAGEVEKVLRSAGIYNGKEAPKKQKRRLATLPQKERSAWQRFLDSRKRNSTKAAHPAFRETGAPARGNRLLSAFLSTGESSKKLR